VIQVIPVFQILDLFQLFFVLLNWPLIG